MTAYKAAQRIFDELIKDVLPQAPKHGTTQYKTMWGRKTEIGLVASLARIIEEEAKK